MLFYDILSTKKKNCIFFEDILQEIISVL